MKLDAFVAKIETIAPLALQESWDHSGWQLRLTDGEIHRVLIALEINEPVIDEAIAVRAEVILTHHPLLFSPLREVDCNTVIGDQMIKLIQNRISVYATHTPFDKCSGGNNDYIGKLLQLQDVQPMETDTGRVLPMRTACTRHDRCRLCGLCGRGFEDRSKIFFLCRHAG